MIKQKLTLLADATNIFNFSQNLMDSYSISEEDKEMVSSVVKIFSKKVKEHYTLAKIQHHISNNLSRFDIVSISKYSLPFTFNAPTKKAVVNIAALGKRSVSSIDPRDLYTLIVSAHVFANSILKRLPPSLHADISEFMSAIFLKIFAKKFGLIGSFYHLIPELRYLVSVFVFTSFFDYDQKESYKTAVRYAKYSKSSLKIDLDDYDFRNIYDLIKALNDNGTLPGLTSYMFVSIMISNFGEYNLSMFEDLARFNSAIVASSINGNTITTPRLQLFNPDLYNKITIGLSRII